MTHLGILMIMESGYYLVGIILSLLFGWINWFETNNESLSTNSATSTAIVVKVVDGDTIDVFLNGSTSRIRYIGIDTPEPYREGKPECGSLEATAENKRLVLGKTVELVSDKEDKDKFGRLLRYVYVDGFLVNATMIENGFATPLSLYPNDSFSSLFKEMSDKARLNKTGPLWSDCSL